MPALIPNDENSVDVRDRKRMKERLKETLELKKKRLRRDSLQTGWLEYLFGICEADGRIGKARSRCVQVAPPRSPDCRSDSDANHGPSGARKYSASGSRRPGLGWSATDPTALVGFQGPQELGGPGPQETSL